MTDHKELRGRAEALASSMTSDKPRQIILDLLAALDEQQKVIEKLPKDADGITVPPGDFPMYRLSWDGKRVVEGFPSNPGYRNGDISDTFKEWHLTREAAEAAREKDGE